jgi:hypothetical protein
MTPDLRSGYRLARRSSTQTTRRITGKSNPNALSALAVGGLL